MEAGVYDYANGLMDYFAGLPGVPDQMKEKMKQVKEADMGKLSTLIATV
jgi:hypothetical protein